MKRTKFNSIELSSSETGKLINCEKEIQTRLINQKYDAYEIGEYLDKAKKVLPHGTYKNWIDSTFGDDLPYSTAYMYQKIYLAFKDNPSQIAYVPTKYLLLFSQNQFPEETLMLIKEKLEENPKALTTQQLKTVDNLYTQLKSGTIGGSVFNKHAKDVIEIGKELYKNQVGRTKHRINRVMRRPLNFGVGDLTKRIDSMIGIAKETAGRFPYDPESKEHQATIKHIDISINKLNQLKSELEGGEGFFIAASTPNGTKYL